MIDFLNNDLGDMLHKAKMISETQAWFRTFDVELKNKVLDWIRLDQLQKGIDEDEEIMGLYSYWTEIINPEKKAGTPYTLKDTGYFYRSLFIDVLSDSFEIDGDGQKYDDVTGEEKDLFELYGEGIVGLTEKNKVKLSEELTLKYIEYAKSILRIN
jgi:hypothetical protein